MNNERRKALRTLASTIESLIDQLADSVSILEALKEEEQETFDNMPESFQNGEKGEKAQAAIDQLEEATTALDLDTLRGALENIEGACE